jgi:hypothetical protein
MHQWLESPRVGGCPYHLPERLGAIVIQGGALTPLLRSARLCVSVAPGLDGVVDVAVIANPMAHGTTSGGRLVPSLLLGLGTPSSWAVGATTGRVTTAHGHR